MKVRIAVDLTSHLKRLSIERDEWLSIKKVADETGLSWETIKNLKEGKTTRFDSDVLAKICKLLEVPDGEPVPFLKVVYVGNENEGEGN